MSRLATARAVPSPPALAIAESGSITMQRGRCSRTSDVSVIRCSSGLLRFGPAGIHPQNARLDVRFELNSDRRQIARDRIGAFVEAHEQRSLAAPASGTPQTCPPKSFWMCQAHR